MENPQWSRSNKFGAAHPTHPGDISWQGDFISRGAPSRVWDDATWTLGCTDGLCPQVPFTSSLWVDASRSHQGRGGGAGRLVYGHAEAEKYVCEPAWRMPRSEFLRCWVLDPKPGISRVCFCSLRMLPFLLLPAPIHHVSKAALPTQFPTSPFCLSWVTAKERSKPLHQPPWTKCRSPSAHTSSMLTFWLLV